MRRNILIMSLCFLICSTLHANNIRQSKGSYYGYDGIFVQTFDNGSTIQTEIVHTYMIIGDLGVLPPEYYLPEIDKMYAKMLNTIVSYYIDSCPDEYYSWYRYESSNRKIDGDIELRRPFNRVYIDLIITKDDFERSQFTNIDFRFCFNSTKSDKEIRRTSMRGVKYTGPQQLLSQFNRGLIFTGCIATKHGLGGTSVFAMENIIQPKNVFNDEAKREDEGVQFFKVKGIRKSKVNLPPDEDSEEYEYEYDE